MSNPLILPTGKASLMRLVWLRLKPFGANLSPGNMILNQDFKEFIQSLNDNHVRYLIVGGYAVAFHGHPRYTKDLDIWLWVDKQNAQKMVQALEQFGFATLGLTPDDFLEPGTIIQLGYPPNRIDLITKLVGVDFETCFASRVEEQIDNRHYWK
jgi:hypothetical protein